MGIFKRLTPSERKDYEKFVEEDEEVKRFIQKARLWHPVIRKKIARELIAGIN